LGDRLISVFPGPTSEMPVPLIKSVVNVIKLPGLAGTILI
jgi:hypothetical protein